MGLELPSGYPSAECGTEKHTRFFRYRPYRGRRREESVLKAEQHGGVWATQALRVLSAQNVV